MHSIHGLSQRWFEFKRFVLVGGGAALGYFTLACVLELIGMGATSASAVAYALFVPISYLCHRRFTFNSIGHADVELPKFVAVALLGIAIGALVPYFTTDIYGFPGWLGFALVCALVPIISFAGLRLWVFRNTQEKS